jgi:hypothetical protein
MDINTLPRHARTGVLAVGWRKARSGETGPQPIWPLLGAAEDDKDDEDQDDDADDDQGEPDEDTDPGDQDGDDDADGADALGDKGKQALDRMKAKLKTERDRRRAAETERDELKAKPGDEQDPEQIRTAAEQAATAKANARIVRSEVRAAAVGKMANPKDALVFLDLTQFEVDEDGQVDEDDVADAIDNLLKERPYLAAQGRQRFQGGGDGGARQGSGAPVQVTEDELNKMTPDQIDKARREGRLDDLMGVKR